MLTIRFVADPPASFRGDLGQAINVFHARTVPLQSTRFGLSLVDASGAAAGGLSAVAAWGWLFIDAVWVADSWRGQGAGRMLMAAAEARARDLGCHAVWLDTFQARGFYEALGYTVFGHLEDYPGPQTRWFLRKSLSAEGQTAADQPNAPV